jgi:hypothetical protein
MSWSSEDPDAPLHDEVVARRFILVDEASLGRVRLAAGRPSASNGLMEPRSRGRKASAGVQGRAFIPLTCLNCADTRFFDAEMVGVTHRPTSDGDD